MKIWLSKLWVRNVIGAVVALAAIAVVVFTGFSESWATYRHTVVPGAIVPKGQSGEAGGYTWKIDSIKYLNSSPNRYGPPLPTGTVIRIVTVERIGPPPEKVVCNGVISDGERRWKSEGVAGFSPSPRDGVTNVCSGAGLLQYTFVTPRDVVPTFLDIVQFDGSITVRLLL